MNLLNTIQYWYECFVIGIQNLVYWLPIIWKDRDYDHLFIEYMLEHKLKAMYKRFSDPKLTYVNWGTEDASKALKALRICIAILKRRREDFYTMNLYDPVFDKSGVQHVMAVEDRDWRVLHTLMKKYMLYWWD